MDGLNNNTKHIACLKSWIDETIQSKGWERFDHLHIDGIGIKFKNPKQRLKESFSIYDNFVSLFDQLTYSSFLCIPLSCSKGATNLEEINLSYIKNEIEKDEPPSLYLFPLSDFNHNQTLNESILIKELSIELQKCVYFKEVWDDSYGYVRSIFVTTASPAL